MTLILSTAQGTYEIFLLISFLFVPYSSIKMFALSVLLFSYMVGQKCSLLSTGDPADIRAKSSQAFCTESALLQACSPQFSTSFTYIHVTKSSLEIVAILCCLTNNDKKKLFRADTF